MPTGGQSELLSLVSGQDSKILLKFQFREHVLCKKFLGLKEYNLFKKMLVQVHGVGIRQTDKNAIWCEWWWYDCNPYYNHLKIRELHL